MWVGKGPEGVPVVVHTLSDMPVVRRAASEVVRVPFTGATETPAERLKRMLRTIGRDA